MTYEELISILLHDEYIDVIKKEYTPQLFGNFIIEFNYKKELLVQMINDRGISEISIVVSSHFAPCVVPLKYAVNYMQKVRNEDEKYMFPQIEDAYRCFRSSTNILNEIIQNNMLRIISKQWKIDNAKTRGLFSGVD